MSKGIVEHHTIRTETVTATKELFNDETCRLPALGFPEPEPDVTNKPPSYTLVLILAVGGAVIVITLVVMAYLKFQEVKARKPTKQQRPHESDEPEELLPFGH
jgi:hypothetical protein